MTEYVENRLPSGTIVRIPAGDKLVDGWPTASTFSHILTSNRFNSEEQDESQACHGVPLTNPVADLPALLEARDLGSKKWRTQVTNIVADAVLDGWLAKVELETAYSRVHCKVSLFSPGSHVLSVMDLIAQYPDDFGRDLKYTRVGISFKWASDYGDRTRMLWERDGAHNQYLSPSHGPVEGALDCRSLRSQIGEYKGYDKEAGWRTDVKPLVASSAPAVAAERMREKVDSLKEYKASKDNYDPNAPGRKQLRDTLNSLKVLAERELESLKTSAERQLAQALDGGNRWAKDSLDTAVEKSAENGAVISLVERIFADEGATSTDRDGNRVHVTLESSVDKHIRRMMADHSDHQSLSVAARLLIRLPVHISLD